MATKQSILRLALLLYGTIASAHPSSLTEADHAENVGQELSKRVSWVGGNCGIFATASRGDALDQNNRLYWLQNGNCDWWGCKCSAAAGACIRMSCYNTTGVYLCNDNSEDIEPYCADLAAMGGQILNSCSDIGSWVALSGQLFSDQGYNVIIGYANCNDSPDVRPDTYNNGWPGPNGTPYRDCINCIPSGSKT